MTQSIRRATDPIAEYGSTSELPIPRWATSDLFCVSPCSLTHHALGACLRVPPYMVSLVLLVFILSTLNSIILLTFSWSLHRGYVQSRVTQPPSQRLVCLPDCRAESVKLLASAQPAQLDNAKV
jgi:hypothetical protein